MLPSGQEGGEGRREEEAGQDVLLAQGGHTLAWWQRAVAKGPGSRTSDAQPWTGGVGPLLNDAPWGDGGKWAWGCPVRGQPVTVVAADSLIIHCAPGPRLPGLMEPCL